MLADLLYQFQAEYAPLHLAARGGHTACVERLLSTPGIDVNITDEVTWPTEYQNNAYTVIETSSPLHLLVQMINMQHYCSF